MAATDLGDQARGIRLVDVHDRQRRVVREVDVVVADKQRLLADRLVMAGAATVGGLGVGPEFLLETQDIFIGRDRTGVRCVAEVSGCAADRVFNGLCTTATGGECQCTENADQQCAKAFCRRNHRCSPYWPMQCTAVSANTCLRL